MLINELMALRRQLKQAGITIDEDTMISYIRTALPPRMQTLRLILDRAPEMTLALYIDSIRQFHFESNQSVKV